MFRIRCQNIEDDCEPYDYKFNRVVSSKNSAPVEVQFIAQENARQCAVYLLAAETVLKSTYMDHSLDSVENEEQGVELYHQLKALWEKAGMQTRRWVSNIIPKGS